MKQYSLLMHEFWYFIFHSIPIHSIFGMLSMTWISLYNLKSEQCFSLLIFTTYFKSLQLLSVSYQIKFKLFNMAKAIYNGLYLLVSILPYSSKHPIFPTHLASDLPRGPRPMTIFSHLSALLVPHSHCRKNFSPSLRSIPDVTSLNGYPDLPKQNQTLH